MSSFEGFEDHEIDSNASDNSNTKKEASFGKKASRRSRPLASNMGPNTNLNPLPENAKLSLDQSKRNSEPENPDLIKNIENTASGNVAVKEKVSTTLDETSSISAGSEDPAKKLEILRERRKLIERENKKKKEILAQTLATRKQQTNNEAEKLKSIQEELISIDAELSSDVRVLMDAIQMASVEFTDSQKRYDRIEKDYISAKLDLQAKSERKEMLMEHLATIIEQNEMRKAERLAKIMEQLGVQSQ